MFAITLSERATAYDLECTAVNIAEVNSSNRAKWSTTFVRSMKSALNTRRISEIEFQRQLHLPRRSLVYGRTARRGDPPHSGESNARTRIIELRCVGHVERFRPELEPAALLENEILEQGEVDLLGARTVQNVAA